jgi:hypothetical protein
VFNNPRATIVQEVDCAKLGGRLFDYQTI